MAATLDRLPNKREASDISCRGLSLYNYFPS